MYDILRMLSNDLNELYVVERGDDCWDTVYELMAALRAEPEGVALSTTDSWRRIYLVSVPAQPQSCAISLTNATPPPDAFGGGVLMAVDASPGAGGEGTEAMRRLFLTQCLLRTAEFLGRRVQLQENGGQLPRGVDTDDLKPNVGDQLSVNASQYETRLRQCSTATEVGLTLAHACFEMSESGCVTRCVFLCEKSDRNQSDEWTLRMSDEHRRQIKISNAEEEALRNILALQRGEHMTVLLKKSHDELIRCGLLPPQDRSDMPLHLIISRLSSQSHSGEEIWSYQSCFLLVVVDDRIANLDNVLRVVQALSVHAKYAFDRLQNTFRLAIERRTSEIKSSVLSMLQELLVPSTIAGRPFSGLREDGLMRNGNSMLEQFVRQLQFQRWTLPNGVCKAYLLTPRNALSKLTSASLDTEFVILGSEGWKTLGGSRKLSDSLSWLVDRGNDESPLVVSAKHTGRNNLPWEGGRTSTDKHEDKVQWLMDSLVQPLDNKTVSAAFSLVSSNFGCFIMLVTISEDGDYSSDTLSLTELQRNPSMHEHVVSHLSKGLSEAVHLSLDVSWQLSLSCESEVHARSHEEEILLLRRRFERLAGAKHRTRLLTMCFKNWRDRHLCAMKVRNTQSAATQTERTVDMPAISAYHGKTNSIF